MLFYSILQFLRCAAYVLTITAVQELINDHTLLLDKHDIFATVGSIFHVENTIQSFTAPKHELTAVLHCFSNFVKILPIHGSLW